MPDSPEDNDAKDSPDVVAHDTEEEDLPCGLFSTCTVFHREE